MDKLYVCGCGKSYGSYPAFSTHRKTKHNNVTITGTNIPSQQKAKRGRPSCDFKKIPEIDVKKKEYYQGLNIIEYGLLQLEEKYKGKIMSVVNENNQKNLDDIDTDDQQDNQRIKAISTFVKLITNHMQFQVSRQVSTFFKQMITFGIRQSTIKSINLYNSFCLQKLKQLSHSALGINFYIQICLLLSKWLCVMGYSKEILRCRVGNVGVNNIANNKQVGRVDIS